jgi:hypothetical protein
VQERPSMALDKLVSLKLEAAVDQLDENRSALLYLVVTNTAAVPVTVKKIDSFGPEFITLAAPVLGAGITLPPQGSQTFPVKATVKDQVIPGNQRVVLAVDLSWIDGGKSRDGTLSVAQTLPVDVFGESDLLKLMGVPSFLFLPGFLFLATFAALWTRITPKTEPATDYSLSEKALLAISLSLVATFIYPVFTHRNYLRGYGLRDVRTVWFGSILLALIVWIVVVGVMAAVAHYRLWKKQQEDARVAAEHAEHIRKITPTKTDSPLDMVVRMGLNAVEFPPRQVMVNREGAKATRSFKVLPGSNADPTAWVAPPILMKHNGATASGCSWADLVGKMRQDEVTTSSEKLSNFLQYAHGQGWDAIWGEAGTIVGPTPIPEGNIAPVEQAPGVVFVQVPPES